ncbi:MAG: hypothetical protein PVI76_12965, partial [Desulfobacterales bacterium]
ALMLAGALFIGCTYYQPAPKVHVTKPANSFDRSWKAAVGALEDQGVRIASKERIVLPESCVEHETGLMSPHF